ncbi:MAG: hypothetical protein SFU84_06720 [Gemmatimonadales bacterium]|nr:hypothetical protein [Gemmatimonadales bacterium]
MTDLGGTQISSLMETLPGIAAVLRSPVADALVNTLLAAARLRELHQIDADELIKYATRRGLLQQDEGDQLLGEVLQAIRQREERAAAKVAAKVAKAAPPPPPPPAPKPKAAARTAPKPKPKAAAKPAPKAKAKAAKSVAKAKPKKRK